MHFEIHTITQEFILDDEERKKVVYSSRRLYNYGAKWIALSKLGAIKPQNARKIKEILWDKNKCLVTWNIATTRE